MVGVEEAPAAPLPGRHGSEDGMGGEGGEIGFGEAVEEGAEEGGIGGELEGRGAGDELVHFGAGGVIPGPGEGEAEGDDFEDGRGKRGRAWAGGALAEGEAERIVKMADHLVGAHAAPAAGGGGGKAVEAFASMDEDLRVEEGFHG